MGRFEGGGFRYQRVGVRTVGGKVEVVDGYGTALGEKGEGYGAADAGGAAGYDGGFAGEEVCGGHFLTVGCPLCGDLWIVGVG